MTLDVATGEIVPALPHPYDNARATDPGDTFSILERAVRLADVICDTEMVPTVLRGRPDAITAVILHGYELGLGPMQSLQTIDLIQGRPALSPEGMRALVLSKGHTLIVDATDEYATVKCHRREWAPDVWTSHSFTLADAERAKLLGKGNWITYPRAMLTARATGEAVRATFPDVIAGVSYTPEEIEVPAAGPPPGNIATPSARPDPPGPAASAFDPACAMDGQDELEARLLAAPETVRTAFREWRKAKGYGWPPSSSARLATMTAEVDRIEAEEDRDTYDPPIRQGGGGESSPND